MSVSSASTDPIQAVVDILDEYTTWSLPDPLVYKQSDVPQQERKNKPDPAIYVWSPLDGTLEPFDAEFSAMDETQFVECSVWVLDDASGTPFDDCATYADEIVQILSDYANDNYQNLQFHHIRPTVVADNRHENITRITDHHVINVQARVHNLRDSGA